MANNIVIGAGISGLSFAYFSKDTNIIFEKENKVGGLCKSIKDNGFIFDYAGHFIHIKSNKIKALLEKLLNEKLLVVSRNSSIYFNNKLIPFPFQANLYYLNDEQKEICIKGIKNRKNIKIYDDMPFIKWCKAMFGDGITKYFMQPYNTKLWSYNLNKMTAAWTAPFVPKPTAKSIIDTAYVKNNVNYGYNSIFYYPKLGCGKVTDAFYKKLKKSVLLNSKAEKIDWKNKIVHSGNKKYCYDNLISTQPLNNLLDNLKDLPNDIQKLKKYLVATSVRCINIGITYKKEIPKLIKNQHWIYFPQIDIPFYRIGIYSNVSSKLVPKNSYSLYAEFSSIDNNYYGCEDTIEILKKVGAIGKEDTINSVNIVDMPTAYVIFNKERNNVLSKIKNFLNSNKIYCIGRYGAWEYSFIEKNIIDAQNLAKQLNKLK